ncbi:MAG: hypothetical protein AB8B81_15625 [Halioglobus sp.]
MMDFMWYDAVGNLGVILILAAYLLLQTKKLCAEDVSYSLMNGLGAALVLVSLYYEFNLSAFIIEVFWLLISIYGVVKSLRDPVTA